MKIRATEKTLALFRRLEVKGLSSNDDVDYDAEFEEMEAEQAQGGLCVSCCFLECRCEAWGRRW